MTTKPSSAPWADSPFPLIATPSKRLELQHETHSFVHAASEMAHAHNTILRGLNAILQQGPYVPDSSSADHKAQDVKDFLFYIASWVKMVHHHHEVEESFLFPELEKVSGRPGLMDDPKHQHEMFHDGMVRLEAYTEATSSDEYRWEGQGGVKEIVDSFSKALTDHLYAEIDVCLALKDMDSAALRDVWDKTENKAKKSGNLAMLVSVPVQSGASF